MKAILALVVVAAVALGSFFLFREKAPKTPMEGPDLIQDPLETVGKSSLETKGRTDEPSPKRKTVPGREEETEGDPVDADYQAALTGLRGRVLWASSKKPVAGVRIEAFELGSGFFSQTVGGEFPGFLKSFEPKVSVTTDKEGRFLLKGLERNEFFGLLIGPGTDKRAFRMVDRTMAAGETEELDDILLEDRGSLKGIVVGPDQKPLRGARVYALDVPRIAFDFGLSGYDPEGLMVSQSSYRSFATALPSFVKKLEKKLPFGITQTGPKGSFHIGGLRKGQTSILIVAPDLVRTIKTTTIRPGKERDLGRIVLKEGQEISGRIIDAEGKPLAGVRVSVTPKSPISVSFGRKPKRSDPQGRFRFKGLGRGQHYVLTKSSEDLPWALHGPYRPGDKIEIRNKKTYDRKIIVQGVGGTMIPSASFKLSLDIGGDVPPELLDSGLRTKQHLKKTDKPGIWLLHGVPEGRYALRVTAKGFAPYKARFRLGPKEKGKTILCKLLKGVGVTILAQNRSGKPVSSTRIYFRSQRTRGTILLGRTGKDGTLKVPLVPPTKGAFIARHPRYAFGATPVPRPVNGSTYRVVLPNPGRIQGRIFNSATSEKKPYTLFAEPSWTIRKNIGDLLMPRFTVSRIDGQFSIGGLQPGEYRVMPFIDLGKASSLGDLFTLQRQAMMLARNRQKVIVPEGGVVQLNMDLAGKKTRKGTGKISGYFRIDGKAAGGRDLAIWGYSNQRITTQADGSFQFTQLPKGRFTIAVFGDKDTFRSQMVGSKSVTLKDGEQKIVNFEISLGLIEGEILDPQGNPYDRAQLSLQTMGKDPAWISVFTDDQGKFRQKVHFGNWRITLGWNERRKAGFSLPPKMIQVNSKIPVKVRLKGIAHQPIQGTISLDFSKVRGEWMEEAKKNPPPKAYFQGTSYWQIPLNKDGSPSPLDGKKHSLGDYRIYAYGKGGVWKSKPLKITPANHSALEIVLFPPTRYTKPKRQKKQKTRK